MMAHAQELRIETGAAGSGLWRPSWPLITGLLTYVYLMANGRIMLRDGDTFWHVAVGRWILDHGAIPTSDPFSHTMRGAPWIAHEWPTQILMALAQEAGGWTLLVALSAFAFACATALLTRALLRWLEPIYAILFASLAVFMSAYHALVRPHFIAMPLLVAWTVELVRARDEQRSPRLAFVPLMIVWANVHGGFTLGLALAAAFALEALLEAWPDRAKLLAVARSWGLFVALAAAASLVTPQGPKGVWLTWQVLMQFTYALDFISEWQSPNFHIFQPLELWLLAGLALVLWQGLRLPPMRIVLLAGLLHLALKHVRYIELVGIIGPLVIAAPFGAQWRERRAGRAQLSAVDALFERLARPAGAGACVLALVAGTALLSWNARWSPLDFEPRIAPVRAVQAARDAGITGGRVLNDYGWGGYLAYSGIPPFIDGRSELYGDDFLKQYREALGLNDSQAFEALVNRWGVTWTLLAPGTPAIALLDHLPDWRRVYRDDASVVHVRVQP